MDIVSGSSSAYNGNQALNLGVMLNQYLLDGAIGFWNSSPLARIPRDIWLIVGGLIVAYGLIWFWYNFIR